MRPSAIALAPRATPFSSSQASELDRALWMLTGLALLVLFCSPSRFFYLPLGYSGSYISFTPLNVIDFMLIAVGALLFLRAGRLSARVVLGLAAVLLLGMVVLAANGGLEFEKITDLLLFNLRLVGGLTIGALAARSGMPASWFGATLLAGTLVITLSTFVLVRGGGPSYDLYTQDLRFGGMGMGSNEAGILFAAAFTMLPLLFVRIRWSALAAPLLITGVLVTGSRTAFLLVIPGLFIWIPVIRRLYHGRRAILAWIVFLLFAAAVSWLEYRIFSGPLSSQSVAPVATRLADLSDPSTLGRIEIYTQVPLYLLHHPATVLWGVGASNVAVESFLQDVLSILTYHTHDLLLQFVVAYGLVGVALFAIVLMPLFRRSSRFPSEAARGIRWFALTMAAGQALQYGLIMEKFLLILTMVTGFVAAVSAHPARAETS